MGPVAVRMRTHGAPLGNEATWDLLEVREWPQLVARQTAGLGVAEEDYVDRRVLARAVDAKRPPCRRLADQSQAYIIMLHVEWWTKLELARGQHHDRFQTSRRNLRWSEKVWGDNALLMLKLKNKNVTSRRPRPHTTVAAPPLRF